MPYISYSQVSFQYFHIRASRNKKRYSEKKIRGWAGDNRSFTSVEENVKERKLPWKTNDNQERRFYGSKFSDTFLVVLWSQFKKELDDIIAQIQAAN